MVLGLAFWAGRLQAADSAATSAPTMQLMSAARDAIEKKNWSEGAAKLEALLAIDPDGQGHSAYGLLADVYDRHGLSYAKAVELYRRYQERFPHGRLAGQFAGQRAYLERHADDWELLKKYRQVLAYAFSRPAATNVQKIEGLLAEHPQSSLAPDMLYWLASAHAASDRGRALVDLERFRRAFAASGRPPEERAAAAMLRARLLLQSRRFSEALAVLDEEVSANPGLKFDADALAAKIREKQWQWWLAAACFALWVVALGGTGAMRPWRLPGFGLHTRALAALGLSGLVATLVPAGYLVARRFVVPSSFVFLGILGILGPLVADLNVGLAERLGRPLYLLFFCLLLAAGVYLALHLGGTVSALEWPYETWRGVSEE
jgi:tetratricopeptide (TPR) repeat protein